MLGTILAGLVGLTIGSVLNVIITRLPQEEPFWGGRPPCFQCQRTPPWYDLVPLLSYAWLKGQCRFCRASISWRYPAVELAAGLLALALWVRFPGSLFLLLYGPFAAALVVLTVLDVQYYWLPDAITLPGIAFGLTAALILPQVSFVYALMGALGGGLFFRWSAGLTRN